MMPVRTTVFALVLLATVAVAACEPTAPPPGAGTAPPPVVQSAGPPPGTSTVNVTNGVVQIVGTGTGNTDQFDLPAGTAEMSVSTCPSSQAIPFVTLFDGDDNKLGLIVDANYQIKDQPGGKYYLGVAANPDCVWTITLTPN